jgi:hypothetical protein
MGKNAASAYGEPGACVVYGRMNAERVNGDDCRQMLLVGFVSGFVTEFTRGWKPLLVHL